MLQKQGRPDGSMYCPCRTVGMGANSCRAASFTDSQLAQHLSSEMFQQYLTVKMKVGEQRVYERANEKWSSEFQRIQEEMKKRGVEMDRGLLAEQLQRQFPNAYQCGKCGHGPIDHMACSDLRAHHGERSSGGRGAISNACPSCGWFSAKIRDWPKWNGHLPVSVDASTRRVPTVRRGGGGGGGGGGSMRSSLVSPRSSEEERLQLAIALSTSREAAEEERANVARAVSLSLLEQEAEEAASLFVSGMVREHGSVSGGERKRSGSASVAEAAGRVSLLLSPLFFFFILVLAIFFVVQENMKSTKKYERNSILFRIFECRVDLEHILFLCFSRRLVWSAASPSCSSHGAWSSWLHRSSSTLFLVSSFFLSFFLSFSSSFISLFFSCHCPYFSFFFLPFIII